MLTIKQGSSLLPVSHCVHFFSLFLIHPLSFGKVNYLFNGVRSLLFVLKARAHRGLFGVPSFKSVIISKPPPKEKHKLIKFSYTLSFPPFNLLLVLECV